MANETGLDETRLAKVVGLILALTTTLYVLLCAQKHNVGKELNSNLTQLVS